MKRDAGDIIDRLTIAQLKSERIGTEESKKEFDAFTHERFLLITKHPELDWEQIIEYMYYINSTIWILEAALKSEKDVLPNPHYLNDIKNKEVLSEIGRDTIMIRNINSLRVKFKNIINTIVKEGFKDVKKDHASE